MAQLELATASSTGVDIAQNFTLEQPRQAPRTGIMKDRNSSGFRLKHVVHCVPRLQCELQELSDLDTRDIPIITCDGGLIISKRAETNAPQPE